MSVFKFVLSLIVGVAVLFVLADLKGTESAPSSESRSFHSAQQVAAPANLLPKDRYVELMLNFQYRFEDAFHAGICRLRSEGYFTAFRVAQAKLSLQTAQQLEIGRAHV